LTAMPVATGTRTWDAEVFVHLVRIALPMSDLSSRTRREVSGDVTWLAEEAARREPRAHVVQLLVAEVLQRLLPGLDLETAATLTDGLPPHLTGSLAAA